MTELEQDETDTGIPEDLQIWREEGRFEEIDGRNSFVHASGIVKNPGHEFLITHGSPGSSIDWRHVVPSAAKDSKEDTIVMSLSDQIDAWMTGANDPWRTAIERKLMRSGTSSLQNTDTVMAGHSLFEGDKQ